MQTAAGVGTRMSWKKTPSKSAVQEKYRGSKGGSLGQRQTGGGKCMYGEEEACIEERQAKLLAQDVFDASMGVDHYFIVQLSLHAFCSTKQPNLSPPIDEPLKM